MGTGKKGAIYWTVSAGAALFAAHLMLMSYAPEALCALGSIEGCVEASGRAIVDRQPERGLSAARKACAADDWVGCNNLAVIFAHGAKGIEKNVTQALEYYRKACEHDVFVACRNLGNHYRRGLDVEVDLKRAEKYLEIACEGDDPDGCNDLGLLKRMLGHTMEEKIATFKKACDLKDEYGCRNWATELAEANPSPADARKAHELVEGGCLQGHTSSCSLLGKFQLSGIGTEKDATSALRHLESGCRKDDTAACRWLGAEYLLGEAVVKDVDRGLSLLEKACRLGTSEDLCETTRAARARWREKGEL